jgi:hypothetical protein
MACGSLLNTRPESALDMMISLPLSLDRQRLRNFRAAS